MKKLASLLDDFSLKSIERDFKNNLKIVEDFGHLIAEESILSTILLQELDYQVRYRGNINDIFFLSIKRIFLTKMTITEGSGKESLFEGKLALKGKYHLKNIGNGEVEILSSSPYSKFGNTIRKFSKPGEDSQVDTEFMDFSVEEFLKK